MTKTRFLPITDPHTLPKEARPGDKLWTRLLDVDAFHITYTPFDPEIHEKVICMDSKYGYAQCLVPISEIDPLFLDIYKQNW